MSLTRHHIATAFLKVISILFFVALPIFLVSTNVRLAANSLTLYRQGFEKYGIPEVTGIERDELIRASRQIIAYFNSSQKLLDIKVKVDGVEQPLFNQREIIHMKDVKGLFRGVFRVQEVSGGFLFMYGLVGLFVIKRRGVYHLARKVLKASLITLGLVLATGLALLAAFPALFLLFHEISFSNSFWQLDPATDRLVQMFPYGFWSDAAILIVVVTLLEASILAAGSYLTLRLTRSTTIVEAKGEEIKRDLTPGA